MFWNVQRLFAPEAGVVGRALDTAQDGWSRVLYERKVANLAECIRGLCDESGPLLLGLAEVETPEVVRDLRDATGFGYLRSVDDEVSAPTLDALDVALLYDDRVFENRPRLVESIALDNRFSTRDLLRVRLALRNSNAEIEVLVAHWPSRLISEGNTLRMAYSIYLRRKITSIIKYSKGHIVSDDGAVRLPPADELLKRWNTPCFIMGDFNDEPFDASMRSALGSTRHLSTVATRGRLSGKSLTVPENYLSEKFNLLNPCWTVPFSPLPVSGDEASQKKVGGTYYRSPEWRIYDQVLASHGALAPNAPVRLHSNSVVAGVLGDFVSGYGEVSMTTPSGFPRAFKAVDSAGVSDHLPLMWTVEVDLHE